MIQVLQVLVLAIGDGSTFFGVCSYGHVATCTHSVIWFKAFVYEAAEHCLAS
jgi:hypothetical protein